jgi:aminomethyltransferase
MGIIKEHNHTREVASMFDVSHMGNIRLYGDLRNEFLERITVADVKELKKGHAVLSLIMNKNGGIEDDCIITNMGDYISIIVNGACKHKDWAYFLKTKDTEFSSAGDKLRLEFPQVNALIALQGPRAAEVLQNVIGTSLDLSKMDFMTATMQNIKKINAECMISRCGYTGEDGFEIAVPSEKAVNLGTIFLNEKCGGSDQIVKMAGLGCRDTLRLECGMCLYGHELNDTITPVESQLMWTVGKKRKVEGGYFGADVVKERAKKGVPQRRCSFVSTGMAAREKVEIFDDKEKKVGFITSGAYSPTLKRPIGMAYVDVPLHKDGTNLFAKNRGKMQAITIKKSPLVPTKYYKTK